MENFISLIGTLLLIGIAVGLSSDRKAINWKTVGMGTALQFFFALVVLWTPPGRMFFSFMNDAIVKLLSFQEEGARFVFNTLAIPPWKEGTLGFFFAFQVLTTIIFFSALMSILYYLGVLQAVVLLFAKVMSKAMGTSGAESLSASANIFVGQTEAPLLVKPYVEEMTDSELLTVMVGGMATVAGGVMAAYVGMLQPFFPNIAGHLLAASVMSAPAALVMAKILLPETKKPKTLGVVKLDYVDPSTNLIEAAANGATTGLNLALNVGTMLVAFMGLLALGNWLITATAGAVGFPGVSLETILGWAFAPLAWMMGVPWVDCREIGLLMGEKTVLNEFVAYTHLAEYLKAHPGGLQERSVIIATYALCGFSNFLSIGIQIGGIGVIAPNRKADLARLGIKALIGGTLACFMTATLAGILVG